MNSLKEILKGVKTASISGHVRPDGDCTGSCLATYNYIKENYPDISVDLYLEPVPNIFKFLKKSGDIISDCSRDKVYDIFFAQDCSDSERLGEAGKYFCTAKKTVCIDHHKSNLEFADVNYIFPDASSTSELVYNLMEESKISKAVAECIYLGIIHDTGVFQYSCTSSKTMQIAGKLMDKGIDYPAIVNDTFFTKTYEQIRIFGQAMLKSQRYLNDTCIYTVITKDEMEQFGVLPKHLEGIVSQLRSVKGIEAAIFLYQNEKDNYKVSLRSGNLVDVSEVAQKFGGGGHAKAAGITMHGEAGQIRELLLKEIQLQLENRIHV